MGVGVTQREKEEKQLTGGLDWAQRRQPAPACVAGTKEEVKQGKQSTGGGRRRKKESSGGRVHACVDRFLPPFPFFLIQFYHKTSTYCINNRIPGPLILNRNPKYNRWPAYWAFDHIKDRFSKFQN